MYYVVYAKSKDIGDGKDIVYIGGVMKLEYSLPRAIAQKNKLQESNIRYFKSASD